MRLTVEPTTDPQDYEFSHEIRVRFVETDAMAIVHHSNYLAYFEETRVAFLAHIGHPFTEWRAAGLESPVLESFVQYRQPCKFDEVLTVHVALAAGDASDVPDELSRGRRWPGAHDRCDRARVHDARRPPDAPPGLARGTLSPRLTHRRLTRITCVG